MKCFEDIVRLHLFPDAKDISESYAAIAAVIAHGGVKVSTQNVSFISIGDGATPRTAGLAAFITRWRCVAVDPGSREDWAGTGILDNPHGVHRLRVEKATFEDFMAADRLQAAIGAETKLVVVTCVHSHHRFRGPAALTRVREVIATTSPLARLLLVSLPCCASFTHRKDIGREPDISYEDQAVFSACRTVDIWEYATRDAGEAGASSEPSQLQLQWEAARDSGDFELADQLRAQLRGQGDSRVKHII
mmetsp:Transcript_67429/g.159025  ORF Transcript_67429/g.159025 Transcript_67429/m.159025 type:complete len:248 (-) Transcript_67429:41-784(-)